MEDENTELVFNHFYCIDPKGKVSIHHEGLIEFFRDRGFCWLNTNDSKQLVQMQGNIAAEKDITDVVNSTYEFIWSDLIPENLGNGAKKKDLLNLFVRGIANYINESKLRLLPIVNLKQHRDSPTTSYFYCKDDVVKITADDISISGYTSLDGYVWQDQIKPLGFTLLNPNTDKGDFEKFAYHICDKSDKKFESLQTVIGYILHRYWTASTPIIPCLLDETVVGNEEAQGGTGKTLLCQGFSYVRSMVGVDGKNFKASTNFAFQRVSQGTELLFVDDLPRYAVFEDWFSIVSTGLEVNKKFKGSFKIEREYSPKIILTSNFPIRSIAGYSTERRKLEMEIGTHYGPHLKPTDEFGKEFFQGWDNTEFNKMLNFFARCTQKYLKHGLIEPPSINAKLRKLIMELGSEDLLQFLDEKVYLRNTARFHKRDMYDEFLKSNPGQKKYYPSQNRFIRRVHKYLDHRNITYKETPAATRKVIEIIEWGDVSATDDSAIEVEEKANSLANTPHKYTTIQNDEDEAM